MRPMIRQQKDVIRTMDELRKKVAIIKTVDQNQTQNKDNRTNIGE